MVGILYYILLCLEFVKFVKLLIVVFLYYKDIVDQMVVGVKVEIEVVGGIFDVVEVFGVLEILIVIGMVGWMSNYDGFVVLGCVICGEIIYYDIVCNDSSCVIQLLGFQGLCIGNGIFMVENYDQVLVCVDVND